MARRAACMVKGCRLQRERNSSFCSVHSVLSPAAVQDTSAQQRIDEAFRNITFVEREMLKLYTGLGDGYVYTTQDISRIFSPAGATYLASPKRVRETLHRAARRLRFWLPVAQGVQGERGEIVLAGRKLLDHLAGDPQRLYGLSAREFEKLVADLFKRYGFSVELTQQSVDGGRDLVAVQTDRLGIRTSYLVECKRYCPPNKVGVGIARAVYGVKCAEGTDHAIIATTSWFTPKAVEFSRDVLNLHLRDFEDVCAWIKDVSGTPLRLEQAIGLPQTQQPQPGH